MKPEKGGTKKKREELLKKKIKKEENNSLLFLFGYMSAASLSESDLWKKYRKQEKEKSFPQFSFRMLETFMELDKGGE